MKVVQFKIECLCVFWFSVASGFEIVFITVIVQYSDRTADPVALNNSTRNHCEKVRLFFVFFISSPCTTQSSLKMTACLV